MDVKSKVATKKQHVVLEKKRSTGICKVLSGVPQGSVLGPLLFINDITNRISLTIRPYADDLIIYR